VSYFSEKLKTLRTLNGLTQDQFAKKLGLSRSAIGMYETAEREPDFGTLERISSILNVDPGTLIGESKICKGADELISLYQKLNSKGKSEARKLILNLSKTSKYLA